LWHIAGTLRRTRRGLRLAPTVAFALAVASACCTTAVADQIFIDPMFGVNVTSGIQYGSNVNGNGNPVALNLDVYRPTGAGLPTGLPAIVLMHGGYYVEGNKQDMSVLADGFAQRGYVAVAINYRKLGLLPPPPGQSLELIPERYPAWFPGQLVQWGVTAEQYIDTIAAATGDLAMAVNWLAANSAAYNVDPSKIVAGGYSAGAISSLLLGANAVDGASADIAAVVSMAGGLFGWESFISPGDPAVFVVHGTADTVVPFSEVAFLESAYATAGVPFASHIITGVDHGLLDSDLLDHQPFFEFLNQQLNVPEPSSLALASLGVGIGVLSLRGKRRVAALD